MPDENKVIKLTLGNNRNIPTLRELVLGKLRSSNLYRPDLVFRGFNPQLLERVLSFGSENPEEKFIYGDTENYFYIDPDPLWHNPLHYALAHGALAVHKEDKLKWVCPTCYEFIDMSRKPEALLVVFTF